MKKYLLLFLSIVLLNIDTKAQTTYTWNGGTTSWDLAANWTPARTIPAVDDILVINASNTIDLDFVSPQTIGQLQISGGSSAVTFQTGATRVLNIGAAVAGDDFTISAGSSLTVQSTIASIGLSVVILTGNTAKISGAINFGFGASTAQAHRLTTPNAEGVSFESGSSFTTISVSSGNPFGASGVATNNNIVFKSGSTFNFGGGANPFGASQPASVVQFQEGSDYWHNSTGAPSFSGRYYANFILNAIISSTGSFGKIDNLTLKPGSTFTIGNTNNRFSITGNITVEAGGTFTTSGAGFPDLLLIGTGALQTIDFGASTPSFRSISVGADANVVFSSNCGINTASTSSGVTSNNYGKLDLANKVFTGTAGTGTPVFNNRSASTVSTTTSSALNANSNSVVSTVSAGVSTGMLINFPGVFPPNTYIIATSTGTFTTSKYSITSATAGTAFTISNNDATTSTSNSGGLLSALPGTYTYTLNGNFTFNAATTTPFPTTGTLAPEGITTNASITLNRAVNLFNVLTVNSGTLTTGGNLTLKSDATGTARIASSAGSISGNVTVERYIPASGRRAWRLLGANVSATGSPTINASWQEGGAATTTGTHITQAGGAGTNGFDASTVAVNPSIQYYDGANLQAPTNTDVTKITDNSGAYFLFVRGNRTLDINTAGVNGNTTLRQTGAVNQSTVVSNSVTGAFTLIPNPYASPVDYETIATTAPNTTNLPTGQYYIWDANMASVGGYRTIQRTGVGTYTSTPTTGDDNTMRYIRSGQAFFIPVASQVTFTEGMKTAMLPTINVYRTGAGTEEMTIDLRVMDGSANGVLYDGVRAQYNNNYSVNVNTGDAPKLNNFNENLAITRNNFNLAIEQRPLVDAADTIFLNLWNTGIKNYRFDINPSNFSTTANLNAYLVDGFLNTTTPVSLSANTMYDFSITSNTASADANRFMIVYKASTPLPVNFTQVKAFTKNAGIQVEWNVAAEIDVTKYEVEKSTNGTAFDKTGTVQANNSKAYNWFDATPNNGANFYRIKVINKDNSTSYSNVVNVKLDNTKGDIAVYPNPVKGGVINVQFTNQEKGTYNVQLVNSLGQQIYNTRIVHQGGSSNQSIRVNGALGKGIYQLIVSNEGNNIVNKIIVE